MVGCFGICLGILSCVCVGGCVFCSFVRNVVWKKLRDVFQVCPLSTLDSSTETVMPLQITKPVFGQEVIHVCPIYSFFDLAELRDNETMFGLVIRFETRFASNVVLISTLGTPLFCRY